KSKPDIRKPYRRQLFSSVDHKCPSITSLQCHALPSLRPAKTVRSHSPTLYSSAQEPIRPQFALAGGQGSRNHLGVQRDLDVVLPHGGGHSAVTRVAIPIALQGPFHSLCRDTRKLLFEHIDDLAEVRREQIVRLTQGLGNATDQIGLFASEFWSDKGDGVRKFLEYGHFMRAVQKKFTEPLQFHLVGLRGITDCDIDLIGPQCRHSCGPKSNRKNLHVVFRINSSRSRQIARVLRGAAADGGSADARSSECLELVGKRTLRRDAKTKNPALARGKLHRERAGKRRDRKRLDPLFPSYDRIGGGDACKIRFPIGQGDHR